MRATSREVSAIVQALHGRAGRCQCPACAADGRDKGRNHLAVSERGGKILVHCFWGCSQEAVIAELRRLAVWPEHERREWTAHQRKEWAGRRSKAESHANHTYLWCIGLVQTLESEAALAGAVDDWERLEPVARRLYLFQVAEPDQLLAWHNADANSRWFEERGRAHLETLSRIAEDAVRIIAAVQQRERVA